MEPYLPLVLLSGIAAFLVTPLSVWVARRVGFVDQPQGHKIHVRPVPLLGGLAIYLALGVVLLLVDVSPALPELIAVVVGGTLLAGVGLWDDRRPLPPWAKLLAQVIASLAVIAAGIQVQLLPWPLANILITILWIVGITNAINLMDNMDGLAAGISAVAAVFFLLLASTTGQGLVASMAAAVAGASLGFLFYNVNPAVVFMGDAGSLLLGFLLAVLGIKYSPESLPLGSTWMVPIVVLGLPIFDTTLVTYARWRAGLSLLRGGGDHTSHRLARLGLGTSRAVLTMYLTAVALGAVAILLTRLEPALADLVFGGLVLIGLVGVWLLERARPMLPGGRPIAVVLGGEDGLPAVRAARGLSDQVTLVLEQSLPPEETIEVLAEMACHPEDARSWLRKTWPKGVEVPRLAWDRIFSLSGQILYCEGEASRGAIREAFGEARLILLGPHAAMSEIVQSELARAQTRVLKAPGASEVGAGATIAPPVWAEPHALGEYLEDALTGHRRKGAIR